MNPGSRVEKTQVERITECMTIIKKLINEVGIPALNPSVVVLKKRMAQYWRDGQLYEGSLPLVCYDRIIIYRLPRWNDQKVEVTLRVSKDKNPIYPADLEEEICRAAPTHQQQSPVDAPTHQQQSPADAPTHQQQSPVDAPTHQQQSPVDAPTHQQPLSGPEAASEEQTSSVPQSDPSHPSPSA